MPKRTQLTLPEDDEEDEDLALVSHAVAQVVQLLRKIGNAILGGDFSGDARGYRAIDIQTFRDASEPGQVASGDYSLAIGSQNTAAGLRSVALGNNSQANATDSVAIAGAVASGVEATAIGRSAQVTGLRSLALGYLAQTPFAKTSNITGANIISALVASNDAADWMLFNSGMECCIFSDEIDFKTVADQSFTFPAGLRFWPNEVGVTLSRLNTLTTQPTVRFGISGTPAKHVAAVAATLLTALGKRERYTPLTPEDGETSLSAGVTVAAVATQMRGHFYWRGLLVRHPESAAA